MIVYRIIVGILFLSLLISSGVSGYLYVAAENHRAQTNDSLTGTIWSWGLAMFGAGSRLQNASTSVAVSQAFFLFETAESIVSIATGTNVQQQTFVSEIGLTSSMINMYIRGYIDGVPAIPSFDGGMLINQTAVKMFAILNGKIQMVFDQLRVLNPYNLQLNGTDPLAILGVNADSIISGCQDIRNYAGQIDQVTPKFL